MRKERISFSITKHICLQQAFMVHYHGVCTQAVPAPTLMLDLRVGRSAVGCVLRGSPSGRPYKGCPCKVQGGTTRWCRWWQWWQWWQWCQVQGGTWELQRGVVICCGERLNMKVSVGPINTNLQLVPNARSACTQWYCLLLFGQMGGGVHVLKYILLIPFE